MPHCIGKLALRECGKRGNCSVIKTTADDGGDLGHFLDRLQSIEPRHQRVVQRARDRQRAQRRIEVISLRGLAQRAQFDDRLCHFLDKKRYPVGLCRDLVEESVRHLLAARDARDDCLGRHAAEPIQRQPGDDRMAAKGCDKGRARGDQHENPGALDAIEREFDQLQRRRVDPVSILNHPEHRLAAGQSGKLVDQHGKRTAAALFRRQLQRTVTRNAVKTH